MNALLLPLLPIILLVPPTKPITKNIVLLVDVSESMGWDSERGKPRLDQALSVSSTIARQPIDEANLTAIAWSNSPTAFGKWIELPNEDEVAAMESWLGRFAADGTTKLAPALRAALALKKNDLTVIIVTDGDLHAETEAEILKALAAAQAARQNGPATVGVWGVAHTEAKPKLAAIARAGGGGYVVGE